MTDYATGKEVEQSLIWLLTVVMRLRSYRCLILPPVSPHSQVGTVMTGAANIRRSGSRLCSSFQFVFLITQLKNSSAAAD